MQFKVKEDKKTIHCYNRVGLMQVIASLVPEPYDIKKSCFAPDFHWFFGDVGKIYHPNLQWFLMEINKQFGTCFDAKRCYSNGAGYIVSFDKPVKLKDVDFDSLLKPKHRKEESKQQEIIIKDYKETKVIETAEITEAPQKEIKNEQQEVEENLQDRVGKSSEGKEQEGQSEKESVTGSGNVESNSSERDVVTDSLVYPDFDSMVPPQWSKKKVAEEAAKFGIEVDSTKKMKEMVVEFKEKYENQGK
jgi:hypothetical protein